MGQYEQFFGNTQPCNAGFRNQCAVRMSIALGGCGFDFDAFPDPSRVHRSRSGDHALPHVPGAHELAQYLRECWSTTQVYRRAAAHGARADLNGRPGVIYFNNCFRRTSGGPMTGDHIDCWSGWSYMNELLNASAGGRTRGGTDLFSRSDAVWFFRLP